MKGTFNASKLYLRSHFSFLTKSPRHSHTRLFFNYFAFTRTVLVAPGTVDFSEQAFDNDGTKDRISRHANFDHMPELMQRPLTGLSMNVYYL